MSSFFMDSLEPRMFLSVGVDIEASDGTESDLNLVATLNTTTKASGTLKKGWYKGSGTLKDESGSLYLQVQSIASGKITGKLQSAEWGAFSVSVSGSFAGGVVSLTGKNSDTNIKSFKGTLSGSKLSGTSTIVQMGVTVKGKFAISYTSSAPGLTNVKEPSVLGSYDLSVDGKNQGVMYITKQVDGKFWGKVEKEKEKKTTKITGVILASGHFGLYAKESEGYTIGFGTRDPSTGTISGDAEWHDNSGDTETQTFKLTKKI
jgi:hypothetical protein